jgi:hypothetical protein
MGSLHTENRAGEFGAHIVVSYQEGNHEDARNAKLLVETEAVTLIDLPSHLNLGSTVFGQKPQVVTFEVTKDKAEVNWDELRVLQAQSKIEVTKTLGERWAISVIPPLESATGSYREDLTLELANSKDHKMIVCQKTSPLSWKTISENFSINSSGVYLSGDHVAKVRIKSLKSRLVELARIELPPNAAPIQVKQVKENDQLHLEVQNFQSEVKLQRPLVWKNPTYIPTAA